MEDWEVAVQAAQARSALDTIVLHIGQVSTLTEQFVICHGTNSRQVQAIADSVSRTLKTHGRRPLRIEGYRNAEWILLDYGDFVVHSFAREKRYYYDLERLWKTAPRLPIPVAA
ncbi:MAG: ribosome silencing factor [Bryobacterales bacterium]|nr:ribosome silencing factor [Bryobacterales bacterium]